MSDDKLGYGWTKEDRAAQLEEYRRMHDDETQQLATSTDVEYLRERAQYYRGAQEDAIGVFADCDRERVQYYRENERLRRQLDIARPLIAAIIAVYMGRGLLSKPIIDAVTA